MLFIRPVEEGDLSALLRMSVEVGSGMTSMPNDPDTWVAKIALSKATFAGEGNPSEEGVYFLVAEDADTGEVVGTSAIYVGIGTKSPFYSYRETLLVKRSKELDKMIEIRVLNLVNDFTRATEVGSLFLSASHRHSDNGQFLSRCRYLVMADFPHRFADQVIAEMRGYQDSEGKSPFWQALGKKFFDLPFENADYLSATIGSAFIQDLMPKYPVYVDVLPEAAQACVGKPHVVSAKAIHLLEKEGFRHDGYVDVFDGGPTVHCRREQIKSVREARGYTVMLDKQENTAEHAPTGHYFISNQRLSDYRMLSTPAAIVQGAIYLSARAAELLHVKEGDRVNVISRMEKNHG